MKAWFATVKAVLIDTLKHPRKTTVVIQDKRAGRVTSRQVRR